MTIETAPMQLLLIDRQHSWLERSAQALRQAGFEVASLDHYEYPTPGTSAPQSPKLVILGCASIGPDELDLISRVIHHQDHLFVLSTALPWNMMRHLFLAGADDVANKPYDSRRLIGMVNQVLKSIPETDQ